MDSKITPEQRLDNKVLQLMVQEINQRKNKLLINNSKNMNYIKFNKKMDVHMRESKDDLKIRKIQSSKLRIQKVLGHYK